MQKSVLNKQVKFGVKILWHYTDMVIFVLRCFILTHPVVQYAQHWQHYHQI